MSPKFSRRDALLSGAFFGGLSCAMVALDTSRAQTPQPAPNFRPLTAAKTTIPWLGDQLASCWCYDGVAPGPILRVKQGEDVFVRLVNQLDQPTSLHWHGLRNDNRNDGVVGLTQAGVAPGAFFDYRFKALDSGLYLYRPAGVSDEQVSRGLGGVLVVDESNPPPVDRDIALVLQDWALEASGDFAPFHRPVSEEGRIGDFLTVAGRSAPATEIFAPGARLRLRLANACAARIAVVTFTGATPYVLAIDGQPCDRFEPVRNILPIAPGARFDLVMDLPAQAGVQATMVLKQGELLRPLAVFKTDGAKVDSRGPLPTLPFNMTLPAEIRLGEAKKLQLLIEPPKKPGGYWTINGEKRGYESKPLLSVKRGTAVSIAFANKSQAALAMHVHGLSMRLLHDLDDGWEPYWRNGVIVPQGARKIIAFKTEAEGKWAVRSDIADQESQGLKAWIEVL